MHAPSILTPEDLRARYPESFFSGTSKLLFRQAIANSPLPVCLTDPNAQDNPIVFVNDAFIELTGYDRAEIIGSNCRFLQGPNTDPQSIKDIRTALSAREPAVIEIVNYRKDGSEFINALHIGPIFDLNGKVVFMYGSQWDVTENASFDSMRRRRALELAGIGVWEYSIEAKSGFADYITRKLFGVENPSSEFDINSLMDNVHPADAKEVRKVTIAAFSNNLPAYTQEFRVVKHDGTIGWLKSDVRLRDADGSKRILGVTQDITERKNNELALARANSRLKVAARELDHRIKNLFNMISSLISLTTRSAPDPATALEQAQDRIRNLADVHNATNALRHGESVPLKELISRIVEPFKTDQTLELNGEKIVVHEDHIPSLGLIIHELITNSVKYGALGCSNGELRITWVKRAEKFYLIDWVEIGHADIPTDVTSTGLGSKLMDVSARQIGGSFMSEPTETGFRASLLIPATTP